MTRQCADCGHVKRSKARGLCKLCYERRRRNGTVEQYPRLGWPPGTKSDDPSADPCARCSKRRRKCARGLCYSCHKTVRRQGRIEDYPRKTWPRDELLAEWDHLRRAGVTLPEAARRLGISRDGLEKAIERAGKRAA